MRGLDELEIQKVEKILHRLPPEHPARRVLYQGGSLVDIAHCIEGMQPDVLRPLLALNAQHQRRLRSQRTIYQERRQVQRDRPWTARLMTSSR